jgi:hypothetical protein
MRHALCGLIADWWIDGLMMLLECPIIFTTPLRIRRQQLVIGVLVALLPSLLWSDKQPNDPFCSSSESWH